MKQGLPGFKLVVQIFGFLIASWFLVHILAVFGVFVAFAYPVWWVLFPVQTPCLFCRVIKLRDEKSCKVCGRSVREHDRLCHVDSFKLAVFNSLLILVFTLSSLLAVFLESRVLLQFGFPPTPKTVSFVIPAKNQYLLHQVFDMDIEVSGVKTPVNAVQADVRFDPDRLEVLEISTRESFASIFIQKEINNEVGFARLSGGLPNPGYSGEAGVFGTIIFRTKRPGLAQVEFMPSSMVLANDGQGTNVLKDYAAVSYLVLHEESPVEREGERLELLISQDTVEATEGGAKLIFYDEEEVLGASVSAEEEFQKEKPSLSEAVLGFLGKFDQFVLSVWGKVFGGEKS